MNTTKPNTKDRVMYRSHRLLFAALAALALAAWTPPVLADCHEVEGTEWLYTDTTWDCVEIENGEFLYVAAGVKLTLTGNNATKSTINGHLILVGSGSTLAISKRSHTFEGGGCIQGRSNSAGIEVGSHLTLTNEITIQGALTIAGGSGSTFDNEDTVRANDATTQGTRDRLTLDSGTFTGSGTYEVNTANAFLKFDATGVTATGLGTGFTVSNGTLDIETNVTTTGNLTFTGGTIDVAARKTFQAG